MKKIALGHKYQGGEEVWIKLALLMASRLLLAANSGAGKSYATKRIIEQAYGKVQIQVIDAEGEFAPLREKFDFVLVGPGGDATPEVRTARLFAQKVMEYKLSVIFDLSEMKPDDRIKWVAEYCDALIELPKNLRTPTLLIVDEAHIFAPEGSKSDALKPLADIGSRGRKRGICLICATQSLAFLDKSVTRMLQNRLFGGMFEDIDIKRAAENLGIHDRKEYQEFAKQMRVMEPGGFWAVGRAIVREKTLFHFGEIATAHGDTAKKYQLKPPPPSGELKKILAKLGDLPKEAEKKLATEKDFRGKIADLERRLRTAERAQPIQTKERAIKDESAKPLRALLREATTILADIQAIGFDPLGPNDMIFKIVGKAAAEIRKNNEATFAAHASKLSRLQKRAKEISKQAETISKNNFIAPSGKEFAVVTGNAITNIPKLESRRDVFAAELPNGNKLPGPEQRVLNAVAWLESISIKNPKQEAVSFLAGYTFGSGSWNNPRGKLNKLGYIRVSGGTISLTDAGREQAEFPATALTADEMHAKVLSILPGPETRLLKVLLEAYPEEVTQETVAEKSGYAFGSGSFNNPRGRLRSLGLITSSKGFLKAEPFLFLE
jgi:hypothetical protein